MTVSAFPLKKPSRPLPGDTFGIIAPSSPFDKQTFFQGIEFVEELGFRTYIPEAVFAQDHYLAGPDTLRAETVNAMFADTSIRGIICARGGFGALRIAPLINLDIVAANPKIFIGYSDVTVLLNMLVSMCEMVSLHGPMITSLAGAEPQTKQALRHILLDEQAVTIIPRHPEILRPGKASGIIAGGNLTTLCHLVGTPYEPVFSGRILLLEDIGESPYRIDRMLTQMKMAGCFDGIQGIMLGSFKNCGEISDVYKIFRDIFLQTDIPILAGFDIGHDEPNVSVPFGVTALLDADNANVQLTESLFCK